MPRHRLRKLFARSHRGSARAALIAAVFSGSLALSAALTAAYVGAPQLPGPSASPALMPAAPSEDLSSAPGLECADLPVDEAARCVEDYLTGLGAEGNFSQALAELRGMMESPATTSFARPACHSATHALGRLAYAQAKSVESAFDLGDSTCNMGFFHGVVEALGDAVATPEELLEQIPSVCSSFPAGERFMVCAHGVGHAAMRAYAGELQPSVAACQLLDSKAAELCATGVFMEWVLTFIKSQHVPILTPRTEPLDAPESEMFPPGLCLSVPEFQRAACFNEMFSTLGGHADVEDYQEYARWCGPDGGCVHGLAVRLPEVLMGDHESSFGICQQAADPALTRVCLTGYLVSWASFSQDREEFEQVCAAVPEPYADACAEARRIAESSTLFFEQQD